MKKIGLSVIIPIYNAKDWIVPTIGHIVEALKETSFNAEIIVIDDGSSDGSAEAARSSKIPKGIDLRVVTQENAGRYLARKHGVELSTKDNILFVDSRVYVDKQSLVFLESKLRKNPDQLWNGHVNIDKKGNIFARFWDAIVCIAWRRYFRRPKTTSYGLKEFDYYPKGTTFFYVPKARLLAAMDHFEKITNDIEHSSDDTLLIRYLIKRQKINLSPDFSCLYHGRSTFKSFLSHAFNRGQFFIDGFFRPGTRFFYPLIAVLITSIAAAASLIIYPLITLGVLGGASVVFILGLFAGALAMGVALRDAASLAILGVPFAIVYMAGLWRGVARKSEFANRLIGEVHKPRVLLRGTIGEYLIVAFIYLIFLVIFTGSVITNINTQIYSGPGDATAGFLWINSTDDTLNPFVSYYDNTNYPFGENTSGITLVSYLAYWLPMRIMSFLLNPVAALNITMFAGYILSAMAMYLVIKRFTGRRLIAFTAGFAAAFVPYALIKSVGHMSYIFGGIFTLIIGSFIAFWERPSAKKSILLGVLVGLTFYFDGYFILISIVLASAAALAGVVYSVVRRESAHLWLLKAKYTLLALGVFLVMAMPLLAINLTSGDKISSELASNRSDISHEIRAYRSNVIDFLTPQAGSLLWSGNSTVERMIAQKNQRSNGAENTNYISPVIYLIATIGMILLIIRLLSKKRASLRVIPGATVSTLALVGLTVSFAATFALAFMFSPEVIVKGVYIPLPGSFLIENNIAYWRVMSRLFVLFNVVVVIWFAVSLWLLICSFRLSGASTKRGHKPAYYILILGLLGIIIVDYVTVFPTRPYDFTKSLSTYKWLKDQESIKSVAILPLVDPLDPRVGDYVTAQIIHEKNVINQKVASDIRLNNALDPEFNVETLNFLRERRVDAVLLYSDTGDCERRELGGVLFSEKTARYDLEKQRRIDTTLCTLSLDQSKKATDSVYAVFKEGFSPSPGATDQSDVAFREGGQGIIELTTVDLRSKPNGKVAFGADLRLMPDVKGASWRIIQGDQVIATGPLSSSNPSKLSTTLDGHENVKIVIKTPGHDFKHAEAYIERVVVSATKD